MSASPSVPDLTAPLTTPAPGRRAWWKYAVAAVIVIALLVAPLVLQVEANQQLARVGVFAVAVLGLNVIMGYTGQVSLGQIFFVGFGAYATAYGVNNDWPIVVTFIAAIVLPGIAGLIVAFAAARLGGLAIAMVTIALPVIGVPLAKRLSDLTGGSQGTSARSPTHRSGPASPTTSGSTTPSCSSPASASSWWRISRAGSSAARWPS